MDFDPREPLEEPLAECLPEEAPALAEVLEELLGVLAEVLGESLEGPDGVLTEVLFACGTALSEGVEAVSSLDGRAVESEGTELLNTEYTVLNKGEKVNRKSVT